ncbi:MAG: S9 family peptidase [Deltaproteobacteria bacterium]|nr:S9 family peptidase [Deltaproteobacteria bacterium]
MPKKLAIHDDVRIDPYYWMRDRDSPELIAHLEAENAYTAMAMKPTQGLQSKLFLEFKARIQETDSSVPYRHGPYWYYSRTVEGLQYAIYCRKRGSIDAAEQVLLDVNELARGHEFFQLGVLAISPDHRLLAYGFDTSGDEIYTLRIKDLDSGELLDDALTGISGSAAWAADNRTLFYTVLDPAMRPHKLFRHRLGEAQSADRLIHHETDEAYHLDVFCSRSEAFVFLHLGSIDSDELRYLPADRPDEDFRVLLPRKPGLEYAAAHCGEHFYLLTNDQAVNFRVVRAPVRDPRRERWEEIIPHDPAVKLDAVDLFSDHMVISLRADGISGLRVRRLQDGATHDIRFPEAVHTVWLQDNTEFHTDRLRIAYESLVTPESIYDYAMDSRVLELKKRKPVLGGYRPEEYESDRIHATASDGTRIPISIVHRKGLQRDGRNPAWLTGYGAYGVSYDPTFSSSRLSLLDRGFVYAIAHVRGGGELGRPWYDAGKLHHKTRTFTDFIACAERLISEGYTSRQRMAISGGSAGGLLIGAVLNMRPDLFRVAVADVPFVDVLTTMLDPSIPLTVIEYREWGNPNDRRDYETIKSYSPYDNVRAQAYPDLLVLAGLNDPRVQYWEPSKWVARLRALKTGDGILLQRTNMGAGHMGASGRYDYLKEIAFECAFVLDRLGIKD